MSASLFPIASESSPLINTRPWVVITGSPVLPETLKWSQVICINPPHLANNRTTVSARNVINTGFKPDFLRAKL
ncbi:hypothetical protein, partial [Morganella morganii]|uniref:hypothetical protein n=1 Tax=Morganella morganii TaxID=582 RepID=UPI003315E52F